MDFISIFFQIILKWEFPSAAPIKCNDVRCTRSQREVCRVHKLPENINWNWNDLRTSRDANYDFHTIIDFIAESFGTSFEAFKIIFFLKNKNDYGIFRSASFFIYWYCNRSDRRIGFRLCHFVWRRHHALRWKPQTDAISDLPNTIFYFHGLCVRSLHLIHTWYTDELHDPHINISRFTSHKHEHKNADGCDWKMLTVNVCICMWRRREKERERKIKVQEYKRACVLKIEPWKSVEN